MLSLCLIMIKRQMNTAPPMSTQSFSSSSTARGSEIAAAMEPTETLLETAARRIKTPNAITRDSGEITAKQPAVVATPLPPV